MLIRIPLAKIIFAQVELLAAKYVDCRHYHDYLLGHLPFGRNGTLTFMQTSSRGLVESWPKLFLLDRMLISQKNEFFCSLQWKRIIYKIATFALKHILT